MVLVWYTRKDVRLNVTADEADVSDCVAPNFRGPTGERLADGDAKPMPSLPPPRAGRTRSPLGTTTTGRAGLPRFGVPAATTPPPLGCAAVAAAAAAALEVTSLVGAGVGADAGNGSGSDGGALPPLPPAPPPATAPPLAAVLDACDA